MVYFAYGIRNSKEGAKDNKNRNKFFPFIEINSLKVADKPVDDEKPKLLHITTVF